MRNKNVLLSVLVIALVLLAGCGDKPSGEPKTIAEQYCQNLIDGNFEAAYNLMSSENKSQVTLEEFKDWQNTGNQLQKLISFNVIKEEQLDKYSFNGVEYPYAIKYTLSIKEENYITDKEDMMELEKIVVSQDKEWKLLDENSFRYKYARIIDSLGCAYLNGDTFNKDINQAITCFLKAIEIDANYTYTYYDIACAYYDKEQFDKVLEYTNIGIEKEKDTELLSDLYNIAGNALEGQYKYDEAIKAYEKSLEINQNNVYAKDNLEYLKKYMQQ